MVSSLFGIVEIDDLIQAVDADFQAAQGFLQGFLKSAAYRHDFADRFHLRGQPIIGLRKFFESKTRHFGHHVIDARLERCRRSAAGNFISQLIQGVTDGEFGGDFGDRKPGGFGSQRRRTRDPADSFR